VPQSVAVTGSQRHCAIAAFLFAWLANATVATGEWPAGWRSGSLFGADVRSLVFDPGRPDTVFAGTAAGHVFVSRDGGEGWTAAGAALPFPGWVVASLQFDPNRPRRLWAALWGIFGGGLVAHSDDSGLSWSIARQFPAQVYALALAPGNPGRLYLGSREGVLRSDDDGNGWQLVSRAAPQLAHVSSLWVDPSRPLTVLAGTWRRAYRSDDGGESWRGVFTGMAEDSQVFSLRSPLGDPRQVWASTCGWVYRSQDGGARWVRHQNGLGERRTPSFSILLNGELIAGTVAGAYASTDGGETWTLRTGGDLAVLAIAQDPRRPERILLGTEGSGIWLSQDGGGSYRQASRGLTNVRVAATLWFRGRLLVAVNHAGPASGVYGSRDAGATFPDGPEPMPTVLAMSRIGDRVLVATEKGLFAGVPGDWRRVPELGAVRVEQLSVDGDRWLARTSAGLFEGNGRSVAKRSEVATRSVALWRGDLLAVSPGGLRRHGARSASVVEAPETRLELQVVEDGLLAVGAAQGSAWLRSEPVAAWRELAAGVIRALPTGDPEAPLLLLREGEALLGSRGLRHFTALELPVPARDVLAVQRTAEGLLLGTSGYGVLLYRAQARSGSSAEQDPVRR
jgi:photosystem II stability/assembly factor-like uncharacterized protein